VRLTPHRLKACPIDALKAGDHIAVRRREGYTHHGVYLGGSSVAHFTDEGGLAAKRGARVTESSMEAFLRGGALLRRRHRRALPPEEVVARARAVSRGLQQWRPYHLVRNNCEHFATYCVSRRRHSVQVRQVAGVLAAGFVLTTTLVRRRGGIGL
jgi:hypothetical protein